MSDIDINRVQQNIKELQDQNAITPQKRTLSEDVFYPAADLLDLKTNTHFKTPGFPYLCSVK